MITKIIFLILIILLLRTSRTKNPVELRVKLLIMRSLIFVIMHLSSSKRWFPLIYLTLFLGGVLIIFIILSSLLPNKSRGFLKAEIQNFPKFIYFRVIICILMEAKTFLGTEPIKISQNQMSQQASLVMILLLIFIYFIIFIQTTKKINLPLKTQRCYQITNFVSWKPKSSNKYKSKK